MCWMGMVTWFKAGRNYLHYVIRILKMSETEAGAFLNKSFLA